MEDTTGDKNHADKKIGVSSGQSQPLPVPAEAPHSTCSTVDLDDLLDEALDDFDKPYAAQAEPSPSGSGPVQWQDPQPNFDPLHKHLGGLAKQASSAMAFDPLGCKEAKPTTRAPPDKPSDSAQRQPSVPDPFFGRAHSDFGNIDEEISKGLSQLMAELSQAGAESRSGEAGMGMEEHSKVAETLQALAEQSRSLGDGGVDDTGLFSDPMFARLAEQMSGGGLEGGSVAGLADTLMQQLISKDVLQQSMQQISAKYPTWLATNRERLSAEELARYEEQYSTIQEILHIYDTCPDDFPALFQAMQRMQACGQPPQEIVDELAPELQYDADGLPKLPVGPDMPGCCVQ